MNEFLIDDIKISKDTTINDFKHRKGYEITEMDEIVMIDSRDFNPSGYIKISINA